RPLTRQTPTRAGEHLRGRRAKRVVPGTTSRLNVKGWPLPWNPAPTIIIPSPASRRFLQSPAFAGRPRGAAPLQHDQAARENDVGIAWRAASAASWTRRLVKSPSGATNKASRCRGKNGRYLN